MTGLLLRLAGPMQSWGEHSTFSTRDTARVPTRSALIGLICATQGRRRGDPLDDLAQLRFTIRVDRPGTMMQDFHTVGGGLPPARTVPTADGKRRPAGKATIISRRFYLADAAFTVAATGPTLLIEDIARAVQRPVWAPYLGRRSCPAEQPLLLHGPLPDPIAGLDQIPLNRRRPRQEGTVPVEFVTDAPPPGSDQPHQLTLNDVPVDGHPHRRRYLSRQVYVTTRRLPAGLCAGAGTDYLNALHSYLQGGQW
jgi:CRISPR system Cascade subunit CasD